MKTDNTYTYVPSEYEFNNWVKLHGSPIIDGMYNGYKIIKSEKMPNGE